MEDRIKTPTYSEEDIKAILREHELWLGYSPKGTKADLSGLDLTHINLEGIDLRWANLYGANLRGVSLSGADLSGANLGRADLSFTDLSWADLSGANLEETDLKKANLEGANVSGAIIKRTNLDGAVIKGSNILDVIRGKGKKQNSFHVNNPETPNDPQIEEVGAKKNDKKDGKASRRFVHPSSLDQMQFAMDAGEIKYGAYNFMKGHNRSALISAAIRHLEKMMWGEWVDEDCTKILGREVTHLGCVMANMNMLAAQIAEGTSRDDTRKKETDG